MLDTDEEMVVEVRDLQWVVSVTAQLCIGQSRGLGICSHHLSVELKVRAEPSQVQHEDDTATLVRSVMHQKHMPVLVRYLTAFQVTRPELLPHHIFGHNTLIQSPFTTPSYNSVSSANFVH